MVGERARLPGESLVQRDFCEERTSAKRPPPLDPWTPFDPWTPPISISLPFLALLLPCSAWDLWSPLCGFERGDNFWPQSVFCRDPPQPPLLLSLFCPCVRFWPPPPAAAARAALSSPSPSPSFSSSATPPPPPPPWWAGWRLREGGECERNSESRGPWKIRAGWSKGEAEEGGGEGCAAWSGNCLKITTLINIRPTGVQFSSNSTLPFIFWKISFLLTNELLSAPLIFVE